MSKSPAFQFYAKDWLSSSRILLLTPAQEGAYIRLLAYDWDNDGLPDNDDTLAVLSRLGEGWLKGSSNILRQCFIQHPTKTGHITNERLLVERENQRIWREKCKKGGIKSAASRAKVNSKGSSTTAPRVVQLNGNTASASASASAINTHTQAEPVEFAHIPTVMEVIDHCMGPVGIAKDYGEYFHQKVTNNNGWEKSGRLIRWKGVLQSWWAADRERWMAGQHPAQPKKVDSNGQRIAEKRVDRSIGTRNEGTAHLYKGIKSVG